MDSAPVFNLVSFNNGTGLHLVFVLVFQLNFMHTVYPLFCDLIGQLISGITFVTITSSSSCCQIQSPLLNEGADVLHQLHMVCPQGIREGKIHLEKSEQ